MYTKSHPQLENYLYCNKTLLITKPKNHTKLDPHLAFVSMYTVLSLEQFLVHEAKNLSNKYLMDTYHLEKHISLPRSVHSQLTPNSKQKHQSAMLFDNIFSKKMNLTELTHG